MVLITFTQRAEKHLTPQIKDEIRHAFTTNESVLSDILDGLKPVNFRDVESPLIVPKTALLRKNTILNVRTGPSTSSKRRVTLLKAERTAERVSEDLKRKKQVMSSSAMRQPRHIFSGPRPPPPVWPQPIDFSPQPAPVSPSSSIQWTRSQDESNFLLPNEYLDLLLEPVADVFNQLRHSITGPLEYHAFKLDECEWPSFERVSSTQFSLTLQVISAACIQGTLPGWWIDSPDPGYEFLLPEGPVQNPDAPMLSDDELLATHHRHSDFDIPMLFRNKAKALQYFRWHDHIRRRHSKLVAKPNDVLQAVSNAFDPLPLRPLYQFDSSELPGDTVKHITETQRPSALQASGILERFMHSKSFLVEIQDIISAGSDRGVCTVYRCKIISIDNQPVALSPSLSLKLFDDRFQVFHEKTQERVEETDQEDLSDWFGPLIMTETLITNEILAYNKLITLKQTFLAFAMMSKQSTLSRRVSWFIVVKILSRVNNWYSRYCMFFKKELPFQETLNIYPMPFNTILKIGERTREEEALSMKLAHSLGLPVPKVLLYADSPDSEEGAIWMTRVPGELLSQVWDDLSDSKRSTIVESGRITSMSPSPAGVQKSS
ncbi:hypothetical protein C0992_009295 [Termitomyces sp. T32_za158]|nr:hypothetical protein C0992_009295 [Termitomyces sp. T32_za158]